MTQPRRRTRPTPKPRSAPRRRPAAPESEISLRAGKGSPGTGGDPGGRYWHIDLKGQRVGRVFINVIDEPPQGVHPSIQIFVNKDQQGRGIGTVAYRLACEASGYDQVYAHMRRSNAPSRKAATAAGFAPVDDPGNKQLTMVWCKP